MGKQFFPNGNHKFPGDSENNQVLGIGQRALDQEESYQNQGNHLQHEQIFFDKNFVESFLNEGYGRGGNGPDDNGKENRQNHLGKVGF